MKKKTLLSWSSGKDSAWALHVLKQQSEFEVVGLFSTVNQEFDRVAMHAVRNELVHLQAQCVDLPIELIQIPYPCNDAHYASVMRKFIAQVKAQGIECIAFGDLFLTGVREYRERNLAGTGIEPIFPLWGIPTVELSKQMIDDGLRAKITCIDPKALPASLAGRDYDSSFLLELPHNADPCGENGEFHSFVYDGPMFREGLQIVAGETVTRDGFIFTDLLLDRGVAEYTVA